MKDSFIRKPRRLVLDFLSKTLPITTNEKEPLTCSLPVDSRKWDFLLYNEYLLDTPHFGSKLRSFEHSDSRDFISTLLEIKKRCHLHGCAHREPAKGF